MPVANLQTVCMPVSNHTVCSPAVHRVLVLDTAADICGSKTAVE